MAYGSWWLDDTIWAPKHTREPAGASEFGAPPGGAGYPQLPGYRPSPTRRALRRSRSSAPVGGGDGSPEPRSPGAGPYPIVNAYHQRSFGVGVRQRGAAVAIQFTTGTTYAKPTDTQIPV